IANGDHKILVGPGDTVVLASSLIPGNENSVHRIINGLTRLGAKVVHRGNAKVHVSGHAAAGELLYLVNVVRPANVLPVHGEARHQVACGALAISTGLAPERVVLADNGVVVDLRDQQATAVGAVPVGLVYVDGASVGELTEAELKDRRILGDEGFVSVFAVIDATEGTVVAGPTVTARGVAESDDVMAGVLPDVTQALEQAMLDGAVDIQQLQQVMRRVVGRWASSKLRRRPMVIPVVVAV
ncbi:MAG: ribonuclease J, partial [Bifidobacteriaceae bacterium]|nr:ribonuclease J [Bifidobacteriaceae bacterium]